MTQLLFELFFNLVPVRVPRWRPLRSGLCILAAVYLCLLAYCLARGGID